MAVCDKCSSLGEVKRDLSVDVGGPGGEREAKSWRESLKPERILKRGYGSLLRQAREDMGFTMEDVARRLSEKESVVRRVENEKLRPNKELSEKLERLFEIDLFEDCTGNAPSLYKDGNGLTIGDVANVK